MSEKTTINMRIDKKLKEEVATIFKDFGLTLSSATILFYKQVLKEKNIPFVIERDNFNEKTRKVIEDAVNGKNINKSFDSLEEFKTYYENLEKTES